MLNVIKTNGKTETVNSDQTLSLAAGESLVFDVASGGNWYGHGFAHRQPYPLNRESLASARFAVNNIQTPLWFASGGYAILAETREALVINFNERGNGRFEIQCPSATITIRIFAGATLPEAHRKAMAHLGWPAPLPGRALLGDSWFCTWTQYPRAITEERILSMARAIRKNNYPCSVLTIDDRWESGFGELKFSSDFPNPKAMVAELHKLGFKVILWITPFINQGTENYDELEKKGFLVMRKDGVGASLLKWWGGTAGLIDLTNPEARDWYKAKILFLKNEIGADGFKVDGGDAKYQPDRAASAWHKTIEDSGYVEELLALFAEIAPSACESRTAWLSQKQPIIWREGGKDSHWGVDNGLKAMVTLGLHLSLLGYDLLIPDMIPGRMQTMVADMPLPTDEFFVRWVEASAFFPIMQFSYFPWNYGPQTAAVCLSYAKLHKALEDYIAKQASSRKCPLLRPLWYDDPGNAELYSVDDEFMLGSDLLVAPVISEAQVARDVVLPAGEWKDCWTGKTYGAGRLALFPAPCPGIPLFVRAENEKLYQTVNAALQEIKRGSIGPGICTSAWCCGLNRDIKITG